MPLQTHKPEDRTFRLVTVYGPTGVGKSWFGASAESRLGGRTLVLQTEGAEGGLTGFDVDISTVANMDEFRAVLRDLKSDPGPYKSGVLVVDSLSQLARFADAVDAEEEFKKGHTTTPLNLPLDTYKRVGEDVRRSIWFARTLPMHVVLVCLDRIFTDKNDVTIRLIGPNLAPALSGDIRAYSDVVAYLTAEMLDVQTKDGKTERRLVRRMFLQPGRDYAARVRAGRNITVPEFLVSPTIEKLLAVFEGGGGKP